MLLFVALGTEGGLGLRLPPDAERVVRDYAFWAANIGAILIGLIAVARREVLGASFFFFLFFFWSALCKKMQLREA